MATKNKNWWRGASIYQIYPRSFCDSNGDGVGDLPGIMAKLPHVANLGVDAIWISPFFRSPMKDFGYDVSDYCDVDPLFGSLADFDALVSRAHELGLKVMIDQVLSHTSDQCEWFKQSRLGADNPCSDWYVWADPKPDGTPPNNWLSVFGGSAWQWESRRRQYYLHNFLSSQPDLNFHCPEVQDQILATVRFWCERGVDGFRFDACNYHFHDKKLRKNPPVSTENGAVNTVPLSNPYSMQQHVHDKTQPENIAFLKRLRAVMDEYDVASVGEVGDDDGIGVMAQYTAHGDKLHMAYSFNFLTEEFSPSHIREEVEKLEERINPVKGWGCWAFSNHDSVRVASRWGAQIENESERAQFAKMLLAMLGSLRGSFCIYQGEELGLTEAGVPYEKLQDPYGITFWPDFKGRDGCRTPIPWQAKAEQGGFSTHEPWLPMPEGHLQHAVDVQDTDEGSVLNFYRTFLKWRRQHPSLVSGKIEFLKTSKAALLLRRKLGEEVLFAAFNLSAKPVEVKLPQALKAVKGLGFKEVRLEKKNKIDIVHLPVWGIFFGTPSD